MATRTSQVTLDHLLSYPFWERVNRTDDPNECWEWAHSCTKAGYGKFAISRKHTGIPGEPISYYAHRAAYSLHHGALAPAGLVLDHLCHNPRCCNPHHLEAVDMRLNTRRNWKPLRRPEVRVNAAGETIWTVRYYERDARGKRVQRGISFRDEALANAVQRAIRDHRAELLDPKVA